MLHNIQSAARPVHALSNLCSQQSIKHRYYFIVRAHQRRSATQCTVGEQLHHDQVLQSIPGVTILLYILTRLINGRVSRFELSDENILEENDEQ